MGRNIPTYEECCAYVILSDVVGLKDIKLHDSPDIISLDHSVGIEVVSAEFEDDKRLETIFLRRNESKKADHMPDGYTENDFLVLGPIGCSEDELSENNHNNWQALELLEKRIESKREKKRSYEAVNELWLYITTQLFVPELKDAIEICKLVFHKNEEIFCGMYFDIINENALISCSKSITNFYKYEDLQYKLAKKALLLQEGQR